MTERPEDPDGRLDIDARFADIVARFNEVGERRAGDPGVQSSAASDLSPGSPTPPAPAASPRSPAPPSLPSPPEPSQPQESGADRAARIDREVERAVHGSDGGHYVPPEPGPLPRLRTLDRLAWVGVVVGILVLLLSAGLWQDVPQWLVGAMVALVVAGFLRLVWQLPRSRDGLEDDGAQV